MSNESDCSSSSDSDYSSDSDIEYVKPVLVKKHVAPSSSQNTGKNKKDQEENSLKEKIAFSNSVRQMQDEIKNNIDDNYTSTDKELLYKIHQLNDLDNVDPVEEKLQWEERQKERLQRERNLLLEKQRVLEESQARLE